MIKTVVVKKFSERNREKMNDLLWSIDPGDKRPGTWWWWFWIFFMENKDNPSKPKQLMVLWSTKNEREIKCNNLSLKLDNEIRVGGKKSVFDGVVAAWYFDGKKMHEDFVLEQCNIELNKKPYSLVSNSKNKTCFYEKDCGFAVQVNKGKKEFAFNSSFGSEEATQPTLSKHSYLNGVFEHKVLRASRLNLDGYIKTGGVKEKVRGTSYFQKVVINTPAFPWYWGIFHFSDGSVLSYFNPHFGTAMLKDNLFKWLISEGNVSLKKGIYFFNKKTGQTHLFNIIQIKRKTRGALPSFKVSGKNEESKISFTVNCYSSATWKFEKKFLGLTRMRLKYNEYPATITSFNLQDSQGKIVSLKELGTGVGNAEHTWGLLI